jgi:putative endonuclease
MAAAYLEARGMRVMTRNWRRPAGELDLVADDHGTRVFVEVRSRTGVAYGDPLDTIDKRKRARIVRAARLYLLEEPGGAAEDYRFDLVGITFAEDADTAPTCVHIPDAFRLGD